MTHHTNETPEPLAGPSVESCATALAEALRREKGWLLDYADSVIRDAIDRKHLEPLAQERAGEMPTLPKSLLNTIGEYGMARTDRVSELTIQHRWLRLVAGIKEFTASVLTARLSDIRAALQAKDAEIAGLKADAGRLEFMCSKAHLRFIEGNDDMWRVYQDEAAPEACAHKWRAIVSMYHPTARAAIDAAIRAQTGGDHG
jgi:hypothetical protein